MSTDDLLDTARMSCRSTLKGRAAAGGAAWATPTMLSTSAAAATTGSFPVASYGPTECLDQTRRGTSGGGTAYRCRPLTPSLTDIHVIAPPGIDPSPT